MKRERKINYYKNFFEMNKANTSKIWKGTRSLVKINSSSKKDIKIIDNKGRKIINPISIANYFNDFFVNIGCKIDKKIPRTEANFHDYMKHIKCDKTFFFKPVIPQEICEIINLFDINKSVGPNSIPVYILKIYKDFFSKNLCEIVNLSFITGIFPDLCKLAKIIPLHKKDDPLFCENYRPIALLPILSKIFEKLIYKRMYSFLEENKLIYNQQFGFRSNYSTEHALINLTEYIRNLLIQVILSVVFSLT